MPTQIYNFKKNAIDTKFYRKIDPFPCGAGPFEGMDTLHVWDIIAWTNGSPRPHGLQFRFHVRHSMIYPIL
jgi:hypothetical protein